MFEERLDEMAKFCPKCGEKVIFAVDMPKIWLGCCKYCQIYLVVNGSFDKEPEISKRLGVE